MPSMLVYCRRKLCWEMFFECSVYPATEIHPNFKPPYGQEIYRQSLKCFFLSRNLCSAEATVLNTVLALPKPLPIINIRLAPTEEGRYSPTYHAAERTDCSFSFSETFYLSFVHSHVIYFESIPNPKSTRCINLICGRPDMLLIDNKDTVTPSNKGHILHQAP